MEAKDGSEGFDFEGTYAVRQLRALGVDSAYVVYATDQAGLRVK